jgi:hypothetical protein
MERAQVKKGDDGKLKDNTLRMIHADGHWNGKDSPPDPRELRITQCPDDLPHRCCGVLGRGETRK